jgi:hypothetical protein
LLDNDNPSTKRRRVPKLVVAAGVAAGVLGLAVPVGALMPMLSDAIWDTAPLDTWEPPPPPEPEPTPAPAPQPAPDPSPAPGPGPAPGPSPEATSPPDSEQSPEAEAKRKELDDAFKAARAALASPGCRDLVRGNPLQVLDDVTNNRAGKTQVYDFYALAKVTDDGRDVYAETDEVGAGSKGTLYFYKSFHDSTLPTSYYNPPSSPDNKMYELTKSEQQLLVVIHELMHLTGTLTGNHTSTDALGNTDTDLGDIQDQIITNCIPNAKRVARPKSGGDDAAGGGGSGGGGPYDGPVISYPDPIFGSGGGSIGDPGDSETPVLGECCDEVPTPTDPGGGLPPDEPQCAPDGCYDPDPGGTPYDPGYGGGGGGGGYGGGDGGCSYDPWWDWGECDIGYYVY